LRLALHVVDRENDGQRADAGGDDGQEHAQPIEHEGKVAEIAADRQRQNGLGTDQRQQQQ
jgi:hypothetical protein